MKKTIFTIICLLLSFTSYSQSDKRPDSYNYNRAMEALDKQDNQEALEYLNKEIKEKPKNGYAYSWIAYIYGNQGENGFALTAADKALKFLPSKDKEYVTFAYTTRAGIYQVLKEYEKALADYEKAIKVDPKEIRLYKYRAQLLFELEKYDLSDKDYQKVVDLDQGDVVGYVGLGRNANARKQFDTAIEKYNYVIKLSPKYSSGYSYRAESYIAQKKYNEAIDDIIQALDIDDDNKAFGHMQEVADSAALPLIAKLKIQIAANPNNTHWPYYLGLVYVQTGKFRKAIECYQKTYEKEPSAFLCGSIADCYDEIGDYNKALQYINTAIEMDTTRTRYVYYKATFLDHAGRAKDAISVMDEYISREPRDYLGYKQRGWIKDHSGDYDGAIEDYTISITLAPDYAYTIMNRGRAYYLKNEKDLAKADFEEVIAKDTVDGGGTAAMYSYVYLGKYDNAIKILNHYLETEKYNGYNYEAACVYSLMDKKEESLNYLRKALEGGYYKFAHMRRDKDLDNVRSMPEFETLLKEYEKKVNEEIGEGSDNQSQFEEHVSEVPFTKEGGVYKVKCEINKLPLHFIFDTGASDVSISNVEASFMLKNNYLVPSDFIGKQNYLNANGDISEGTVINLRNVEFAGLMLTNIKASVVKNQKAPLLLGQSVLGKLGKIEIDNEKRLLKVTVRKIK